LEGRMTLAHLGGYLGTWSATSRYIAVRGEDPVPALIAALTPHWGAPESALPVRWPLHLLAGRA
ncbi:MAG: SAM-dependent methyltransferase, partial [Gammaproteobacteria bacterium]|nr:SAM-dependent methyltransferase [Gammaproteobacteria bacterium]